MPLVFGVGLSKPLCHARTNSAQFIKDFPNKIFYAYILAHFYFLTTLYVAQFSILKKGLLQTEPDFV
jgi:hypothetical protein